MTLAKIKFENRSASLKPKTKQKKRNLPVVTTFNQAIQGIKLINMKNWLSIFRCSLLSFINIWIVLMDLQVCFHSALKHENDASDMVALAVSKL